jgi:hypothetical protein
MKRVGPVHIDLSRETRDDLTVMDVPEDCVGFVMGRAGATLRSMEEEWGSLMFFAQVCVSLSLYIYISCAKHYIYVPLYIFLFF